MFWSIVVKWCHECRKRITINCGWDWSTISSINFGRWIAVWWSPLAKTASNTFQSDATKRYRNRHRFAFISKPTMASPKTSKKFENWEQLNYSPLNTSFLNYMQLMCKTTTMFLIAFNFDTCYKEWWWWLSKALKWIRFLWFQSL